MKNLKTAIIAGALSIAVAMPALASNESVPGRGGITKFTADDTQALFRQDAEPMQLATLSQLEMAETEGAVFPWVAAGVIIAGAALAYTIWRDYRDSGRNATINCHNSNCTIYTGN
uniref:Cobalt/nickel transport protein n=1 Tax=Candidatus Kentrum sp. TC TaxID=2126339 RepID=A0A450YJ70_9GAMM|nr:MAG: hypothetical protein BECKTC1821E_GA0114239_101215 [Candidatus Kentron sp. TC]